MYWNIAKMQRNQTPQRLTADKVKIIDSPLSRIEMYQDRNPYLGKHLATSVLHWKDVAIIGDGDSPRNR